MSLTEKVQMRRLLHLLFRRFWKREIVVDVPDAAHHSSSRDTQPQIPPDPGHAGYNPDAPLSDPGHDRFRRWTFAQRIGSTIVGLDDPSSLTIGIYGSWGEGKTTVLNFLDKELSEHDNVICFRFNPWRYPNEDLLLNDFFSRLAAELDRSLTTWRSRIGSGVVAAGMLVPKVSISTPGSHSRDEGPGLEVDLGEAIRNLGNRISTSSTEDTKARVGKILRKSGMRVVVLMDDIDRLDDSEIQSVFRIVKLTADFENTVYVLAFDPDVVASALNARYTSSQTPQGYGYLEKIIQVPLHLPTVGQTEMRRVCLEIIDNALAAHRIKLSDAQVRRFISGFDRGLLPNIRTPRMAKRYGNALRFSLPILRGEVNAVDLMLIEGLRLVYPRVYDEMKARKDTLTAGASLRFLGTAERQQLVQTHLNKCTESLPPRERSGADALIAELFPSVRAILSGLNHGDENEWAAEQQVCSPEYFDRYFSYSVPEHDLADRDVREFVELAHTLPVDEVRSRIRFMLADGRSGLLFTKLSRLRKSMPEAAYSTLAFALAVEGSSLPAYRGTLARSLVDQVAELVARFVRSIRSPDEQLMVAELLLRTTPSFLLAVAIFQEFTGFKPDGPEEDADRAAPLGIVLAERARASLLEDPNLLREPTAPGYLYAWSKWLDGNGMEAWLAERLAIDPTVSVSLVESYAQRWTNMATGTVTLAFDGLAYRALKQVFDPGILMQALAGLPENGKGLSSAGEDGDLTLVEEFIRIHMAVVRQS